MEDEDIEILKDIFRRGYLRDGMLTVSQLQYLGRKYKSKFAEHSQDYAGTGLMAFLDAAGTGQQTVLAAAGGKGDTMERPAGAIGQQFVDAREAPEGVEPVLFSVRDGVAEITLNRPQVKNAITSEMLQKIKTQLSHIKNDNKVKVVVLRGAQGDFSAGDDIKSLVTAIYKGDREFAEEFYKQQYELVREIAKLSETKIVVSLVDGWVISSALGLAAAGNFIIGTKSTVFQLSDTGLGLPLGNGNPYFLTRATKNIPLALYYGLTGEAFGIKEASQFLPAHLASSPQELEEVVGKIGNAVSAAAARRLNHTEILQEIENLLAGVTTPKESLVRELINDPAYQEKLASINEFFGGDDKPAIEDIIKRLESGKTAADDGFPSEVLKILAAKSPLALAATTQLIRQRASFSDSIASQLKAVLYLATQYPDYLEGVQALFGFNPATGKADKANRRKPNFIGELGKTDPSLLKSIGIEIPVQGARLALSEPETYPLSNLADKIAEAIPQVLSAEERIEIAVKVVAQPPAEEPEDGGDEGARLAGITREQTTEHRGQKDLTSDFRLLSSERTGPLVADNPQKNSTLTVNEQLYSKLSAKDRQRIQSAIAGMGEEPGWVMVPPSEPGRAAIVRLEKPIVVNNHPIAYLRLKGVRPQFETKDKWRDVTRYIKVSASGDSLELTEGRWKVKGGMMPAEVKTEFETMRQAQDHNVRTDYPVGHGVYDGQDGVGYVVMGMEAPDVRFTRNHSEDKGDMYIGLQDIASGKELAGAQWILKAVGSDGSQDAPADLKDLFRDLATQIRAFHDAQMIHRFLHLGNFGFFQNDSKKWQTILRDLDATVRVDQENVRGRAALKLFDLTRILYDILLNHPWHKYIDSGEFGEDQHTDMRALLPVFLEGYFGSDISEEAKRAIYEDLTRVDQQGKTFVDKIKDIVIYQKEKSWPLSESDSHYGNLLKALRQIESGLKTDTQEGARLAVSTTNLSAEEELEKLRPFLQELVKEEKEPGSGDFTRVAVISDQHGTINKFDALILDAIRSVVPSGTIPDGFQLNQDISLSEQLSALSIPLSSLHGKLYFHNLGDLMDRGPYGVKVYRRSKELIETGLSDFIIGNHDLWEFMNLQGFHLPWYQNYNFYDYRDDYDRQYGNVKSLVEKYHQRLPGTKTKSWWAKHLADFIAFHSKKQTDHWNKLDEEVNGKKEGLYFNASTGPIKLTRDQEIIWGSFRGYNPVIKIDVYTGVRAVGTVSLKWWQDLLRSFTSEFEKVKQASDFDAESRTAKAWQRAIDIIGNEIIPELKEDLESHLNKRTSENPAGEWWWRVFEAINYQNYASAEWWAKDWSSHKDWGTAVLKELNEGVVPDSPRYVTQANYIEHEVLKDIGEFFRDHFTLYTRDTYQNTYLHAFLPVDLATGEFYFTYKGVEYRGKGDAAKGVSSVWQGLDVVTADVRNRDNTMSDIYEALSLVNSWYADMTTKAKVPNIVEILRKYKPTDLARINGFSRLFTGHLPFHEFSKFIKREDGIVQGFQTDGIIVFTDHGMGDRFGSRGGWIRVGDTIGLRGYTDEVTREITDHPATIKVKIDGSNGQVTEQTVLFENPGVPREQFLGRLIHDVKNRIAELESQSGARLAAVEKIPSATGEGRTVKSAETPVAIGHSPSTSHPATESPRGARLSLLEKAETSDNPAKVALNGFGAIGRDFLRAELQSLDNHEIVAANDLIFKIGTPEAEEEVKRFVNRLQMDFDTKPGSQLKGVKVGYETDEAKANYWLTLTNAEGTLLNNGTKIRLTSIRNVEQLPWVEFGVDTVIEATGLFAEEAKAALHLKAGAKKVIISAPGKGDSIKSITPGATGSANDFRSEEIKLYDCASCTTNSLSGTVGTLLKTVGIERYILNTVHAYTQGQSPLDEDIQIAATGAAKALQKLYPQLKGRGTGKAQRVPTIDGSLSIFTFTASRATSKEEINRIIKEAAEGPLKGILRYRDSGEARSKAILGTEESGIFEANETEVVGDLVTIYVWYDNEFSYANRLVDLVTLVSMSGQRPDKDGIRKRQQPPSVRAIVDEARVGLQEGAWLASMDFALFLHKTENDVLQHRGVDRLGSFITVFVLAEGLFGNLRNTALVDHSLWRIFQELDLRNAGMLLAKRIENPSGEATLVKVLGRFVNADPAIKKFMQNIASPDSTELISKNKLAVLEAQKSLERTDVVGTPPTQEQDLNIFGSKIRRISDLLSSTGPMHRSSGARLSASLVESGAASSFPAALPFDLLAQRVTPVAGAQTGQVFINDAVKAGANGVIIGHSETRPGSATSVNDEVDEVERQLRAAVENESLKTIILAVGEQVESEEIRQSTLNVQLSSAFRIIAGNQGLIEKLAQKLVIAYEPRWAIAGSGQGRPATPEYAQAAHRQIRDILETVFGIEIANKIRIIYGGSADAKNAFAYLSQPDIDGLLPGGASKSVESFLAIVHEAEKIAKQHFETTSRGLYIAGNQKTYPVQGSPKDFANALRTVDRAFLQIGLAPTLVNLSEWHRQITGARLAGLKIGIDLTKVKYLPVVPQDRFHWAQYPLNEGLGNRKEVLDVLSQFFSLKREFLETQELNLIIAHPKSEKSNAISFLGISFLLNDELVILDFGQLPNYLPYTGYSTAIALARNKANLLNEPSIQSVSLKTAIDSEDGSTYLILSPVDAGARLATIKRENIEVAGTSAIVVTTGPIATGVKEIINISVTVYAPEGQTKSQQINVNTTGDRLEAERRHTEVAGEVKNLTSSTLYDLGERLKEKYKRLPNVTVIVNAARLSRRGQSAPSISEAPREGRAAVLAQGIRMEGVSTPRLRGSGSTQTQEAQTSTTLEGARLTAEIVNRLGAVELQTFKQFAREVFVARARETTKSLSLLTTVGLFGNLKLRGSVAGNLEVFQVTPEGAESSLLVITESLGQLRKELKGEEGVSLQGRFAALKLSSISAQVTLNPQGSLTVPLHVVVPTYALASLKNPLDFQKTLSAWLVQMIAFKLSETGRYREVSFHLDTTGLTPSQGSLAENLVAGTGIALGRPDPEDSGILAEAVDQERAQGWMTQDRRTLAFLATFDTKNPAETNFMDLFTGMYAAAIEHQDAYSPDERQIDFGKVTTLSSNLVNYFRTHVAADKRSSFDEPTMRAMLRHEDLVSYKVYAWALPRIQALINFEMRMLDMAKRMLGQAA